MVNTINDLFYTLYVFRVFIASLAVKTTGFTKLCNNSWHL